MKYKPACTSTWAVYHAVVRGDQTPNNVVCQQYEWEALERSQPGCFVLVQGGITSEGQAERLARGTSGDPRAWGRQRPVVAVTPAP